MQRAVFQPIYRGKTIQRAVSHRFHRGEMTFTDGNVSGSELIAARGPHDPLRRKTATLPASEIATVPII